jgi:type I restriction enzyme, S subunit
MSNVQVPEGYKQTEVGVIPDAWIVQPLALVTSLDVGYAFKSSWYQKHSGIPLLRGENVGYGQVDWSDMRGLLEKKANPFLAYQLHPGDIVIGMDRTFTKSGTKISLLQEKDCPCLLVQRVGKFFPLKCGASFLWALLSFPKFQLSLQLEQKGMDIPHLSRSEILQPYIALPPTKVEQEAIAQALSDVDALIASLGKLIDKQRHLKTAAMQQLLTGKVRLPGFGEGKGYKQTEVGAIPEDWEVKRLCDVLKIRHGRSQHEIINSSGIYPILATGGEIGRTNIPLYSEPSVLIGRKGIIDTPKYMDTPFWTVDTLFYSEIAKYTDPKFIFYKFNLIDWYSYNEASGVPSLNAATIERIDQVFPTSKEEQCAIATVLSDMDTAIAALETRRAKTQAIKQGMMQELLTGRIRLV